MIMRGKNDLFVAYNWNGALYHFRYGTKQLRMIREVYFRLLGNKVRDSQMALGKQRVVLAGLVAAPGKAGVGDSLLIVNYWEKGFSETMHTVAFQHLLTNYPKEEQYGQSVLAVAPQKNGSVGVALGRYRKDESGNKRYYRICQVMVSGKGELLGVYENDLTPMESFPFNRPVQFHRVTVPDKPDLTQIVVAWDKGTFDCFGFKKQDFSRATLSFENVEGTCERRRFNTINGSRKPRPTFQKAEHISVVLPHWIGSKKVRLFQLEYKP